MATDRYNPRSRYDSGDGDYRNYVSSMTMGFGNDYERRRRAEVAVDSCAVVPPESAPLSVEITEFYARDNARPHHTDQFELVQGTVDMPAKPVIRRGQPFFVAVRFNRVYEPKRDVIRLIFNFGHKPAVPKGTRVILTVSDKQELASDKKRWDVRVHHQDHTTVTVQIHIPASAKVGIWHCTIQSGLTDNKDLTKDFFCKDDIYVLFNPWCQEDGVFLENRQLRHECVLNDIGKVWMGSSRKPRGRRWIFGQFDDVVLPVAMYLLELSELDHSERGCPVQVSRALSAVINSNDDHGVLRGNWSGEYADGTAPSAWTGSIAILEQYLKNGWRSVCYGQCWVFSAVTTTVCRALGIPCRSVTNFVSAHDTNNSLTVDKYFQHDGEEIYGGPVGTCRDSCWNFHVWNDVWMTRPDLPPGYGGWQIIDSTPQERSNRKFQCGPASMEAIRRGEVGFCYDTPFVFAEVNADVCHFQEDPKSDWGFSRMYIDQYHVGRKIVTKRADKDDDEGDTDVEDITHLYKDAEGSRAERLAVLNAVRGSAIAQRQYDIPKKENEDVTFDLVEIDTITLGQNFSITVEIHNKSDKARTISCMLSASTVFYTGCTACKLTRAHGEFVVQPGQRETLRIQVNASDYLDKLVDHSLIKIYAIANVKETQQTWSEEDDFPLQKPRLNIQIRGSVHVGQAYPATFSFQNPLPTSLTGCSFCVEGPGLQRPKTINYKDVKPGELVSFTEYFIPKKSGDRKLVGTFNSKQLSNIAGSTAVSVQS